MRNKSRNLRRRNALERDGLYSFVFSSRWKDSNEIRSVRRPAFEKIGFCVLAGSMEDGRPLVCSLVASPTRWKHECMCVDVGRWEIHLFENGAGERSKFYSAFSFGAGVTGRCTKRGARTPWQNPSTEGFSIHIARRNCIAVRKRNFIIPGNGLRFPILQILLSPLCVCGIIHFFIFYSFLMERQFQPFALDRFSLEKYSIFDET